jgi:hypothetical protein
MAVLLKAEENEDDLSGAARNVVEGIRQGLTEAQAADRAGVSRDELRVWMRDRVFRAAVHRARREGPYEPHIWTGDTGDTRAIPPPGTPEREIERQGWRGWGR